MKKLLLAVLLFMSFNKLNSAGLDFYRKLIDSYECLIKLGGKTHEGIEVTRIELLALILHNFKTIDFNNKEIKELLDSRGYTEKQINDRIHNHKLTLSQLRNSIVGVKTACALDQLIATSINLYLLSKIIYFFKSICKCYVLSNYQTH